MLALLMTFSLLCRFHFLAVIRFSTSFSLLILLRDNATLSLALYNYIDIILFIENQTSETLKAFHTPFISVTVDLELNRKKSRTEDWGKYFRTKKAISFIASLTHFLSLGSRSLSRFDRLIILTLKLMASIMIVKWGNLQCTRIVWSLCRVD